LVSLAKRHLETGPFVEGIDPPSTTVHIGATWGGTVVNMIPEAASLLMEWRPVPADEALRELNELRAYPLGWGAVRRGGFGSGKLLAGWVIAGATTFD
jgi:hypothetical protein